MQGVSGMMQGWAEKANVAIFCAPNNQVNALFAPRQINPQFFG